jgi:hypothetical protein
MESLFAMTDDNFYRIFTTPGKIIDLVTATDFKGVNANGLITDGTGAYEGMVKYNDYYFNALANDTVRLITDDAQLILDSDNLASKLFIVSFFDSTGVIIKKAINDISFENFTLQNNNLIFEDEVDKVSYNGDIITRDGANITISEGYSGTTVLDNGDIKELEVIGNNIDISKTNDDHIIFADKTITKGASKISLVGTQNDDIIKVKDLDVSIDTKEGNDTIQIQGANKALVNTGEGDDTVTITSSNDVDVSLEKGNDIISIEDTDKALVNAGEGDDTVTITSSNDVDVSLEKGDDIISIEDTDKALVNAGEGDDTVTITSSNDVDVSLEKGDDSISIEDTDKALVNAGEGDDTVTITSSNDVDVSTKEGNDSIFLDKVEKAILNLGLGDDKVTLNNSQATVNDGGGLDKVTLSGDKVEEVTLIGNKIQSYDSNSFNGIESINDTRSIERLNVVASSILEENGKLNIDGNIFLLPDTLSVIGTDSNDVVNIYTESLKNLEVSLKNGDDVVTVNTTANSTIDLGLGTDILNLNLNENTNIKADLNDSLFLTSSDAKGVIFLNNTIISDDKTITYNELGFIQDNIKADEKVYSFVTDVIYILKNPSSKYTNVTLDNVNLESLTPTNSIIEATGLPQVINFYVNDGENFNITNVSSVNTVIQNFDRKIGLCAGENCDNEFDFSLIDFSRLLADDIIQESLSDDIDEISMKLKTERNYTCMDLFNPNTCVAF